VEQPPSNFFHGFLAHAVDQNISLGVQKQGTPDLVFPIIVMRQTAQTGLDAAQDRWQLGKGVLDQVGGQFDQEGVTPEAPTTAEILAETPDIVHIALTPKLMREARDLLSTTADEHVDAVAVGSPHLSYEEFGEMERLIAGRHLRLPFYANTNRLVVQRLEQEGRWQSLLEVGLIPVVDTCIVVTPILPEPVGVLLTNSGKFSCYAPGNTGYAVQFGSLSDCVVSAVAGTLVLNEEAWS